MKPKVALIMATLNALDSHKTASQVLRIAKSRFMETVVAVDNRTTDGSAEQLKPFIDRLVPFPNTRPYCEEILDELQAACRSPWCFLVSDDELPSEELWQFAKTLPKQPELIYRPQMVSPLPGWKGHYGPLRTRQPRLFPAGSVHWRKGGIDIPTVRSLPEQDRPEVLWHFNLWASRAAREAKCAAHQAAWKEAWKYHPWEVDIPKSYLYEDYPEEVLPLEVTEIK